MILHAVKSNGLSLGYLTTPKQKANEKQTGNKPMNMTSPVRSGLIIREGSPWRTRSLLRWEGFVENVGVGFEHGVKGWGWE